MGQTQTTKSKIRIETAFDLSYLQSGDRNVDLKQISQRRGLSKTKWFPECIEYASDERRLYVLASDHVISITRSGQSAHASVMRTNLRDIRGMALSPCSRMLYLVNSPKRKIFILSVVTNFEKEKPKNIFFSHFLPSVRVPVDIAFARSEANILNDSFALVTCYKSDRVVRLDREMRETRLYELAKDFEKPTGICVAPGSRFALIGSGKENGKKICWLDLITGESFTLFHERFSQPEGRPLISPASTFALVPNTKTNTMECIRIDPDKRSVRILESISFKSLRSPLNGTFAVGKKNSLVAFIPSESCDRVIRLKFSSMNTSIDLDTRRRRIILEFAIVLERHHVCTREVLVHILNF